ACGEGGALPGAQGGRGGAPRGPGQPRASLPRVVRVSTSSSEVVGKALALSARRRLFPGSATARREMPTGSQTVIHVEPRSVKDLYIPSTHSAYCYPLRIESISKTRNNGGQVS